jgi:hypothetical protein
LLDASPGSIVAEIAKILCLGGAMKTFRLVTVVALSILAGASRASASPFVLYGTGSHGSIDSLFTVNTGTGATTAVGPTGQSLGVGGLAFDPLGDILYATGQQIGQTDSAFRLFTVDRTTGAATLVGSTGIFDIGGLAFDTANNTLYGLGCTAPCGIAGHDFLYSLNTGTGAATQVGGTLGTNGLGLGGLEYVASSNLLYAIGQTSSIFGSINPTTGVFSSIGSPGSVVFDGGLAFNPDTNTMFATAGPPGTSLYTINLATGAGSFVGANSAGDLLAVGGLAFVPAAVTADVPEPTSLLLLGSGFVGFFARRRRSRPGR